MTSEEEVERKANFSVTMYDNQKSKYDEKVERYNRKEKDRLKNISLFILNTKKETSSKIVEHGTNF